jgi:DNA (cytosine-5)-methyltransferase 1
MIVKYVDLFAGIGGIRLGLNSSLNNLGIQSKCVFSSEIDAKAQFAYEANFNEKPFGDIRKVEFLPHHNILLAGFPCQPFSYAGKQRGFGDTRGTLFFEIERLLAASKPEMFLLENVRGLTTHDGGRTLKTIYSKLESLGYGVAHVLLNSAMHGVPQNRMRVYVVGIKKHKPLITIPEDLKFVDTHAFSLSQPTLFDEPISRDLRVKDILEENPDERFRCSAEFTTMLHRYVRGDFSKLNGMRLIDARNGNSIHSWDLGLRGKCTPQEVRLMNAIITNRRKHIFGTQQDGKALTIHQIRTFFDDFEVKDLLHGLLEKGYLRRVDGKYSPTIGNMSFEVFKFLDLNSVSVTLVSSDANRIGVVDNLGPRRITVREAARLQGFPDSFRIHPNDNAAYHQFGNSVSVPVISKVLSNVFSNNSKYLTFLGKVKSHHSAIGR